MFPQYLITMCLYIVGENFLTFSNYFVITPFKSCWKTGWHFLKTCDRELMKILSYLLLGMPLKLSDFVSQQLFTSFKCKYSTNTEYGVHGNHIGMETLFLIVHMQKKNLQTHRKKNYLTLFIDWSKLADK